MVGAGSTVSSRTFPALAHCCRSRASSEFPISSRSLLKPKNSNAIARLFGDSGFIVIVALISPFAEDRARARQIVGRGDHLDFVEVYLDAGVEVCEQRDAKGLYRKARLGQIADFTGVSATYEAPTHPDLLLCTGSQTVEESLRLLHERVSQMALGNA